MVKLTKAQRRKLLDPNIIAILTTLPDAEMLAAHDLLHDLMEQRYGSHRRSEAGRAALADGGRDDG